MSFRFTKTINLGLLRITLSRSGIGWSIGTKGFRTGINSKGKKFNHISIPGTGISKRSYENANFDKSNFHISWSLGFVIFITALIIVILSK